MGFDFLTILDDEVIICARSGCGETSGSDDAQSTWDRGSIGAGPHLEPQDPKVDGSTVPLDSTVLPRSHSTSRATCP